MEKLKEIKLKDIRNSFRCIKGNLTIIVLNYNYYINQ